MVVGFGAEKKVLAARAVEFAISVLPADAERALVRASLRFFAVADGSAPIAKLVLEDAGVVPLAAAVSVTAVFVPSGSCRVSVRLSPAAGC